jgi:LacI family transcriptional regulator
MSEQRRANGVGLLRHCAWLRSAIRRHCDRFSFWLHFRPPMSNAVTITKIAEAAGVSTATVDRVLNNRPASIRDGAQRCATPMATWRRRADPRPPALDVELQLRLRACPPARLGFFDLVDRGRRADAGEFRHQHITEVTHRLPAADANVFAAELAKLLGPGWRAPARARRAAGQARGSTSSCAQACTVVTLFSDVPGSLRETAIGADNRAAGRTAGLLLGRSLPREAPALCALLSPATRYAARSTAGSASSRYWKSASERDRAAPVRSCPSRRTRPTNTPARCSRPTRPRAHRRDLQRRPVSFGIARALAEHGYGPT